MPAAGTVVGVFDLNAARAEWEVAALGHYLVSPEASFTTGQCCDISGGRATY